MIIATQLEFVDLKEKLESWLTDSLNQLQQDQYVVFFSYGGTEKRCQVWSTSAPEIRTVVNRTLKFVERMFEKTRVLPVFLKFDIAKNIEKKTWKDVDHDVNTQPHNNHYRKGISFDQNFEVTFLEQEIYGRALIKGLVYNQPNFWDEKNINDTIKAKYPQLNKTINLQQMSDVWVFDTTSVIYEAGRLLPLHSGGPVNGVRILEEQNKKTHVREMILKNAAFLHSEIQDNGQFVYGYYPAYNRALKSYNTVRHCTSLYALIETFEVEDRPEFWPKIQKGMEYALQAFYREVEAGVAHMIDGTGNNTEIKLGANAAAVMMFTKYQEVTGDDQYQHLAENIARGIQQMVSATGETTHVLHYPSLELKEQFRIVYYDGEAALGLLRLYQINKDEKLLSTVKTMFEHFIVKKYDKYHDHWLSYCVNELTKISPEEKYFQFGLNNYLKHMNFIRNRKTAYATFLEMMMSAYKMVQRLKAQGYDELFAKAKFEELKELIELRVEYQRTGYFYPEVAMYMAAPGKILNAFYVRHDRFRTRIDDQEHNLSGYVAYLNHFEC